MLTALSLPPSLLPLLPLSLPPSLSLSPSLPPSLSPFRPLSLPPSLPLSLSQSTRACTARSTASTCGTRSATRPTATLSRSCAWPSTPGGPSAPPLRPTQATFPPGTTWSVASARGMGRRGVWFLCGVVVCACVFFAPACLCLTCARASVSLGSCVCVLARVCV
eukprot:2776664-Rhodomonas_salina.1